MNISTTQTFQKMLQMLQTFEHQGLKFAIETPDGKKWQSKEEVGGPTRQRKHIDRGGIHLADFFKDKLDNMKPGDLLVFDIPPGIPNLTGDAWRSAISARCATIFGKQNYMTSTVFETGALEVMRIA